MTFHGKAVAFAARALPVLLAALVTALVLLLFPLLSASKKPIPIEHAVPAPVIVTAKEISIEAGDAQKKHHIAQTRRSITQPLELPPPPDMPPATPALQLPAAPPSHEPPPPQTQQEPSDDGIPDNGNAVNAGSPVGMDGAADAGAMGAPTGAGKGLPLLLLKKVEPYYPERSRRLGQEGHVLVCFEVDASGKVRNPEIIRAEPEGHFERAALNAIRQWRFKAAQDENGKSIPSRLQVRIDFKLIH